ncbi:MAG TPA: ABC transporter permease [Blastocatellia bacterium]|jgi:putative ABC transport system permease protein|nr:ABC transporter permease [Blastocatellia bacterium]
MTGLLQHLFQFVSQPWRRMLSLLRRGRHEREMEEEMRFHLEMQIEQNLASGMAPEEAHYAARRQFGNQTWLKEVSREMWSLNSIETLIQDLRYGARRLIKNPGFTLIAVITLAFGIGANTAIFSVVNAVLLRPLPYPNSERMVYIFEGKQSDPKAENSISPHNFTDIRSRNQSFDSYFAFNYMSFTLTGDQQPEELNGVQASADFGRVVGIAPFLGRVFTTEEDAPGKGHVALISDGLWRRRFGADPQILGRNVQLNGEPYTVIGVMPPNFDFPNPNIEVWAPLALDLAKYSRGTAFLTGAARLKPNVTVEQARADLQNIAEQLKKEIPNFDPAFTLKVETVREHLFGDLARLLMILLGAVALVLLIACVNVANLMLGRATARWKEMALRSALGASRWSLVQLLLVESALLAVIGGVLGLLLASYGVNALVAINPIATPTHEKIAIDGYVIAFTFLISFFAVALFGLAPAWQATKTDLNQALRENSRSATGARRLKLMRGALAVAEISLSLVLLVSAGLLLESLWRLLNVNPGFRAENVVTCSINLPRAKYPDDRRQAEFFRRTLEQARAIPGVESAGFGTSLPFSGSRGHSSFRIDDRPTSPIDRPNADRHQVAPGYFTTMGIPLLAGRDFTDADSIERPGVVIINEAAARRFWPNENPLGKHITIGMPQEVKLYGKAVSREIIGVFGAVKHEELKDDFQPEIYIPTWQLPTLSMTLIVRGKAPAESLINGIRHAVQSIDPEQPIRRAQLLETAIARTVAPQRLVTVLLSFFAALAMTLAMIGIYGVMSYNVAQRTQEIGVRMALGARSRDVLKLILRQGMTLALIGVSIGLPVSAVSTRLVKSMLFGVGPNDPLTFMAIALSLTMVALLACLIPARRATKVDPMVALRVD